MRYATDAAVVLKKGLIVDTVKRREVPLLNLSSPPERADLLGALPICDRPDGWSDPVRRRRGTFHSRAAAAAAFRCALPAQLNQCPGCGACAHGINHA